MFRYVVTAALGLLAAPALAEIDRSVLLDTPDWQVRHEYFVETGGQACAAATENIFGDVLDVTTWPNGEVTLYLLMAADFDGWSGAFEADALIEVGGERWTLENTRFRHQSLEFTFHGASQAFEFLTDLHRSDAVQLMSPDGAAPLARWTFDGAAEALDGLDSCQQRIRSPEPPAAGILS